MNRTFRLACGAGALALLAGCQSNPPMPTVGKVELERFMGDWYVIANIPTWPEKGAHNAIESYRLDSDGSIATTFTFNEDSFDGPRKKMTPRGFVVDRETNATWDMQFVWPIKAEYLIVYVDPGYTLTMIGRSKRDYVWIMARTPTIADADYQKLVGLAADLGYDTTKIEKVPQKW
jgi:apolipoprotein D and lipocalin family protein